MSELGDIAFEIRSKNAGPFWITVDIFCGSEAAYQRVCTGVTTEQVADVLKVDAQLIKRFDMPSLNAIKLSFPRPQVQGSRADRDMHGAAISALVKEIPVVPL